MKDCDKKSDGRLNQLMVGYMHAVRFDEYGNIHMINIWESLEKTNEGFVSRLMPVMKRIGIPEPRGEVYPAYNVNVFTTNA